MRYLLEHFGVAVAAITGVLAARDKQVDLFGVVALALVTAFGGGTIRDVALGDQPVFWAKDAAYVINASTVAFLTFFVVRICVLPLTVLLVADAFVLALFTMVGVQKGLAFAAPPAVAVTLGVITGVAGGILRDVLTGVIPLVFRREIYLYATASFCGAVVFVLLDRYWPGDTRNTFLAGGAILAMRLAAIRWKLSLPVYRSRHPHDETGRPS